MALAMPWKTAACARANHAAALQAIQEDMTTKPRTTRLDCVMEMNAAGLTNKQMAARLSISPETVKAYMKKLRKIFRARNRRQLAGIIKRQEDFPQGYDFQDRHVEETGKACDLQSMTPRETQILEMLYEGLSTKEIALRLYISPATVAKHRENIRAKTIKPLRDKAGNPCRP